VQLSSYNCAGS
jgi:hypothetical protein